MGEGPTFSPDGNWMWEGESWIPAPPQQPPASSTKQPTEDKESRAPSDKFCTDCGAKMASSSTFCTECGTQLQ